MSSKQYNAKYVYAAHGNAITAEYQQELTATRVSYDCSNPYKYTFGGTVDGKDAARQQAIIDTICYMGWMSLKDSDHNVSGINAAACKRIQREAVETRKAAESLLNAGTITVIGEWSNGIRVGAGPQFVHIDHSAETKIALDTYEKNQSKARKPATVKPRLNSNTGINPLTSRPRAEERAEEREEAARWPDTLTTAQKRNAALAEERMNARWTTEGACSEMMYNDGACCPVSIVRAVATVIAPAAQEAITHCKPRYRVPLAVMRMACGLPSYTDAQIAAMDIQRACARRAGVPAYNPIASAEEWAAVEAWIEAETVADAAIAAITGEEYSAPAFVAPAYVAPAFVAPAMEERATLKAQAATLHEERKALLPKRDNSAEDKARYSENIVARMAIASKLDALDAAPTPIRPSEHYTPRVGDTVSVVYRHENGTTTTRTVDVQRVGHSLFRGFDRTYGRIRSFEYQHIASITLAREEVSA